MWGLRTPKETRRPGMVPFERAFVISYRPSIVTFPLSPRVSEIYTAFVLHDATFPHPTCSLPQNFPMFPCEYVVGLWATKSAGVGLVIVRAVARFPTYVALTPNVTGRRTEYGRTTCNRNALCTSACASRGKNCNIRLK